MYHTDCIPLVCRNAFWSVLCICKTSRQNNMSHYSYKSGFGRQILPASSGHFYMTRPKQFLADLSWKTGGKSSWKCSFDSTLVDEFLTYGQMLIALVSIHFWCFTYFLRCSIPGKHDRDTNGIFQSKFHLISYKSFCSHSFTRLETGINHSGCSNKFFWGEKMLIFSAEHPDQILAVYRI